MRRIISLLFAAALCSSVADGQPTKSICGFPGANDCYSPDRQAIYGVAVAGALSATVPAGRYLTRIEVTNTTANATTGNLQFGTTSGGVDVAACAMAANATVIIAPGAAATAHSCDLLKSYFGAVTTNQLLFLSAATSLNSASFTIRLVFSP